MVSVRLPGVTGCRPEETSSPLDLSFALLNTALNQLDAGFLSALVGANSVLWILGDAA